LISLRKRRFREWNSGKKQNCRSTYLCREVRSYR